MTDQPRHAGPEFVDPYAVDDPRTEGAPPSAPAPGGRYAMPAPQPRGAPPLHDAPPPRADQRARGIPPTGPDGRAQWRPAGDGVANSNEPGPHASATQVPAPRPKRPAWRLVVGIPLIAWGALAFLANIDWIPQELVFASRQGTASLVGTVIGLGLVIVLPVVLGVLLLRRPGPRR